jgi:hypothetical protein
MHCQSSWLLQQPLQQLTQPHQAINARVMVVLIITGHPGLAPISLPSLPPIQQSCRVKHQQLQAAVK